MRKGICKHRSSLDDDMCEARVRYRDVIPQPDAPGSAYRKPCRVVDSEHGLNVLKRHGPQGTCDKYEEPTDEEVAASEAEMQKTMDRMMRTLSLIARIKGQHKGKSWSGTEKCPECEGVLHLSHAACNGHVWGRCETLGCLAWME